MPEGADVFWCAGAGVVGTSQEALDAELSVLRGFLEGWHPRDSAFFFASSAGGVYAGSAGPPFTEETTPVPLAPYGHAKISAEQLTREFSARTGVPVLAARISNLYGPGQDISKPQGLVSQLCRAQLTRQPLSVYVSLDTMRDYLYVDDAARMSVAALDALVGTGGGPRQDPGERALHHDRLDPRRPAPPVQAAATGGARHVRQRTVPGPRPPPALGRLAGDDGVRPHAVGSGHGGDAAVGRGTAEGGHARPLTWGYPARSLFDGVERESGATSGDRWGRVHRQPLRALRAHRRVGWDRARRGRGARQAHLRGQPGEPRPRARGRAAALRRGRHPGPRTRRPADGRGGRGRPLRRGEPRRPVDPRCRRLRDDQRRGHPDAARLGAQARRREVRARLHRRGLRLDPRGQLGRGASRCCPTRRTPPPRRPATCSPAPTTAPTGCRSASPGARTTTGPTSSPRRSSRCS